MSDETQTDPQAAELLIVRPSDPEAGEALAERARALGCEIRRWPSAGDLAGLEGSDQRAPEPEDASALCQALLEGTRDEVLVADGDGRITFVSRRLAASARTDPATIRGQPADRVLEAIGLPAFSELRGMLGRVSCARTEARLTDAEGETRSVLLRGVATRLRDESRRFIWFITELDRVRSVERANRILRSELETQSRLLALVSHELRTPLNVILGQLSLLQRGLQGELTDGQQDSIERSARAGHSLLSLINDLIDFARLEAEELELEHLDFDLVVLVDEVAETARSLLSESDREVVVRHESGEGELVGNGDPDRTRQILTQLVTNAVRFSEKGEIVVETRRVEDPAAEPKADLGGGRRYLAVAVRDSGEGIPEEERERVFEPFHQTARLLNRTREGSGLGLTIARRLARRQGGDLTARRGTGGGSVFTVYLPAGGDATG